MRKFGLAAILTFVDKGATRGMQRAGRAAASLQKRFVGIGQGAAMVGRGVGTLATSLLPLAAGFGFVIKKGMDFEQAVANLRSVTLDMANKTTPALRGLAKTLGATTVFSATQSADAMTELARAGLTTKQIMGAVRGTLSAAAAEGVDLASAARMVSSNMKAFNMDAREGAKIAGMLALASARTNTNMTLLQESLKLAAPAVKDLKVPMSDTVALVGAMADIGLRGTLGATGLRSAVSKLLNPTKDARKAMAQMGLSFGKVQKMMDKGDLVSVFKEVMTRMSKIPRASKRAALAVRVFGIRGRSMVSAMDLSDSAMKRFNETLGLLRKETGKTAEQMAKMQLQTLKGQVTLLSSAVEGLSIEIFDTFAMGARGSVKSFATGVQNVALAMRVLRGEKILDPEAAKQVKEMPGVFFDIAQGIREGMKDVKEVIKSVASSLGGLGRMFGLTGDGGAKSTARIITKVVALGAAFAPVALALAGITRLFVGLGQVALGTAKIVGNTMALAAKGAGGLLGAIGKRVPKFGAFLGKFGGLLGKAGKLTEQVTAQPVRVVNFAEMGAAGAATGALKNQLPLFGSGDPTGANTASLMTRFRGGLGKLVARIPLLGTALNSSVSAIAGSSGSLIGKLGKFGLAIGAAGAAGYAFGSWLDKKFGLSDKISGFFADRYKKNRAEQMAPILKLRNELVATTSHARTINQLLSMRKRGITSVGLGGGKRAAISKEMATERIVASLRRNGENQKTITSVLARLAPLLSKLPGAAEGGAKPAPIKPAKDAMISSGGLMPVSAGDVVLDRASLAQAVVSQMRGGLAGRAGAGALGGGDPGRTSPPPATQTAPIRIEVPVSIDGREVAIAVAEVQLDEMERSGATVNPGDRTTLLDRGVRGVG